MDDRSTEESLAIAITEIIATVCTANSKRLHICTRETIDHVSALLYLRFRHRLNAVDLQLSENRRKLVYAAKKECLKYRQRSFVYFTPRSRTTTDDLNSVRVSKREDLDFGLLSDVFADPSESVEMDDTLDFFWRRSALLLKQNKISAVRRFVYGDAKLKNDYKLLPKAWKKLKGDSVLSRGLSNVRM